MKYTNIPCTACGGIFTENDDVVVCPVCGAPHHRACWMRTGQCAKNDAHAEGFVWRVPEERKAPEPQDAPGPERLDAGSEGLKFRNGESVVSCPQCGSANYQNDIYCLRCGAKLDGTADPYREDGARRAAGDPYYADYRYYFERYGGISPQAPVDGIPCMEYSDFVGGSKPGRIIRKVSTMERYDKKFSWSWAALFLGPVWFFWRKLKKEGAIVAIVLLFLSLLFGLLQINPAFVSYYKELYNTYIDMISKGTDYADFNEFSEAIENKTDAALDSKDSFYSDRRAVLLTCAEYLRILGLPLICALLAIPLYRKHVRRRILQIREQCSSMEEYHSALLREGGTSVGGAVLGAATLVLSLFCSIYLPIILAVFAL